MLNLMAPDIMSPDPNQSPSVSQVPGCQEDNRVGNAYPHTSKAISPRRSTEIRQLEDETWEPGFWTRIPLLGVAALFGVFLCMVFSLIVVIKCDGATSNAFRVRPTVLVAISSATANTLLAFAYVMGSTITWWREALHGCDMKTLHYQWLWSRSFFAAAFSLRPHKPIVLASLLVTLAIIDGPLLQKSIIPGHGTLPGVSYKRLDLGFLDRMPIGSSAVKMKGLSESLTGPSVAFATLLEGAYDKLDTLYGCISPDVCVSNFTGLGLIPYCDEPTYKTAEKAVLNNKIDLFDFQVFWEPQARPDFRSDTGQYTGIRFIYSFMQPLLSRDIESDIQTGSGLSDDGKCYQPIQTVTFMQCWIVADRVTYQQTDTGIDGLSYMGISLNENGTFRLDSPWLAPRNHERELPRFLLPEVEKESSTWGGLFLYFKQNFNSTIKLEMTAPDENGRRHNRNFTMEGGKAFSFLEVHNPNTVNSTPVEETGHLRELESCTFYYGRDPFEDVMAWLKNTAALLATSNAGSVVYDPAVYRQNLTIQITRKLDTFGVNYDFLLGGIAVMAVAATAVGLSYYGWWELGRAVSLSPLEAAQAFNAPIFSDERFTTGYSDGEREPKSLPSCLCCISTSSPFSPSHSNSAEGIVRRLGHVKVRFGEKKDPDATSGVTVRRLEIAAEDDILPLKRKKGLWQRIRRK